MSARQTSSEKKLKALEQELQSLRRALGVSKKGKGRSVSLEGIWKGMEISDKDIEQARAALFPPRH